MAHNRTTHGMSKMRIYKTWDSMKYRCQNPKAHNYHNYGARGITVCDRWQSFENFYADMNATYEDTLELDRIDPNGNYEPSNCRWATKSQQNRNRRPYGEIPYRGVCRTRDKYRALVSLNYKVTYLGSFDTAEEASAVYQKYCQEHNLL